jgi:phospholipase C
LTISGQKIFPCISVPTLVGELNSVGLTWQYFAAPQGQPGYIWSALDAISQIRNSSQWTTNVLPVDEFASNALNGTLANVVWVTPPTAGSDSPPANVCTGEGWAVQTINAIMQSPDWASTTVFLTWSDYGGYYDHVDPPMVDVFGLGIRVPLVMISPYVKAGLVVHDQSEFSSLLAFAENVYGLPPLTSRDAAANNLMDAFDFTQAPLPPLILSPRKCPGSQ